MRWTHCTNQIQITRSAVSIRNEKYSYPIVNPSVKQYSCSMDKKKSQKIGRSIAISTIKSATTSSLLVKNLCVQFFTWQLSNLFQTKIVPIIAATLIFDKNNIPKNAQSNFVHSAFGREQFILRRGTETRV